MARIVEIPVALPHEALANADWADAFEARFAKKYDAVRQAAETGLSDFPFFTKLLLIFRNLLVTPFGLDRGDKFGENVDRVGFFPVLEQSSGRLIAGMNDRHLDFRIVLDLETDGNDQSLKLATIIKRHNWLGRAYLFMITPFHKLIVRGMLKRMAEAETA